MGEGEMAPALPAALFGDGANTYMGRRPHTRVIAFVSSFCGEGHADEADLERIRAEVRGLSATLLVISPRGSWCFGPDDRLFRRSSRDARDEACAAAFQRFGVPDQGGRDGLRAVFVVDGDGTVRFAHTRAGQSAPAASSSQDGLLRALVVAANEMERALKSAGRPSPDQATTTGLIVGFRQMVGGGPAPQARVRRPDDVKSVRPMSW
ncbi:MAG TPA: hypothetical protein VHU40_03255 [Polyangia bacterium]|nr:hypothetical protein [Polyangia bacterium]